MDAAMISMTNREK